MTQAASISVNDRETTPAAHVYVPRNVLPGVATFVEPAAVPIGDKTLIIRTRRANSRYYVRLTLTAPVLVTETINGVSVPKVHRVGLVDCNFRFDDTSSLQERKNLVGMFAGFLDPAKTVVDSTLTGLEGIW